MRRNVWRLMLSGAGARAAACSASLCESEQAPRAFGWRCRFASPSGTTAHAMPTSSCTELRIAGSMQQSGARAETTRCRPKRYGVLAEIELAPVRADRSSRGKGGCLAAASAGIVTCLQLREGGTLARPWPKRMGVQTNAEDPGIVLPGSLLLVLTPLRCQCGDAHSTFGSPIGRDRRVMTIPAARSAAAEALAS